jgi:hypothetical protein
MKTKPAALILAAALIFTLAGCAGRPETGNWQGQGNTPGNIINGGIAAISGDWIYYRNQADEGGLYKIHIDGVDKQKLSNDIPRWINVMDDWIYFYNSNDLYTYRISTTGRNRERIFEERIASIYVENEWIYYRKESVIHKYNIENGETTKLSTDECGNIFVSNSWIYYNAFDGGLYRVYIDGTNRTKLTDNKCGPIFIVANDWVYYINLDNNNYIYKMSIDGSENAIFISDSSEYINIKEDWIFYTNQNDGETIYRVRADGTGREKINNDESYNIIIIEDWIYYTKWNTRSIIGMMTENEIYRMRFDGSEHERVT